MKAIVFDFDGVIVLSEEAKFNFLQTNARELGINFPDDLFEKMVGLTTKVFFHKYLSNEDSEKLFKLLIIYEKNYKRKILDYVKPITLTIDFIKSYEEKLKFAVVSGSDIAVLREVLSTFLIIEKFELLISKEDVTKYKPNPEPYLLASKRLSVSPEELFVIEDSVVGAQAAIASGSKCYVLLNGLNNANQFKDMNVEGFIRSKEDLLNLR